LRDARLKLQLYDPVIDLELSVYKPG